MRLRFSWLLLLMMMVAGTGCGRFAARRMAQAPNTYPKWLAPKAPVTLAFSEKILTAFPSKYLEIPSPRARIRYRIIEPANYEFQWTNHLDEAARKLDLSFTAKIDHRSERTNQWTSAPRGTVILLHGYGVSGFAMLPWGLLLGQEGWRCVLVDLRGHGKSTGSQIYFGTQEVRDLRALLDQLEADHKVERPVSVVGHSFGAVIALRWKTRDPRVERVVAMSPYADLSKAILGVSDQYASWLPKSFLKAGLRRLPHLLNVSPCDLNPACWIDESGALFIAGEGDRIATLDQVRELYDKAGPGNRLLVVPRAAHEPLPFYFDDLAAPITDWLSAAEPAASTAALGQ